MTTIAYRDGVLAGDTRITDGNLICPEKQRKVFRLPNGCLFGHAGDSEEGEILKQAFISGGATPKIKNSCAIVVMPNEAVLYFEGQTWTPVRGAFVAIGSGSDYAYGAMQVGASAADAVRAACKLEKNSGLPIHTVCLKTGKKVKR